MIICSDIMPRRRAFTDEKLSDIVKGRKAGYSVDDLVDDFSLNDRSDSLEWSDADDFDAGYGSDFYSEEDEEDEDEDEDEEMADTYNAFPVDFGMAEAYKYRLHTRKVLSSSDLDILSKQSARCLKVFSSTGVYPALDLSGVDEKKSAQISTLPLHMPSVKRKAAIVDAARRTVLKVKRVCASCDCYCDDHRSYEEDSIPEGLYTRLRAPDGLPVLLKKQYDVSSMFPRVGHKLENVLLSPMGVEWKIRSVNEDEDGNEIVVNDIVHYVAGGTNPTSSRPTSRSRSYTRPRIRLCTPCSSHLSRARSTGPPRFAIANGFYVGRTRNDLFQKLTFGVKRVVRSLLIV